ncbi:MAG: tRNA(Ile)-lysidine synthetase [Candidatus Omnitrophota bacterium]|nr:MAG: tRNA(Ile)-lysidine synthetase [Candidatus Omnitrophota bacterium]RKY46424.1 MAG: tRNA(Ile)-lysidine synthetase [Candidatus Omnitrophota bacterium]
MKCRVCKRDAQISLKSYNLNLCSNCFLEFFRKRVYTTINEFKMCTPKDRILVAVSGGKDSLSLWHILSDLGYRTCGLHIILDIGEYSQRSYQQVIKFAQTKSLELRVVSVRDEFGKSIKELAKIAKRPPCRVCGMVKRYLMNREAEAFDCLATGHNLDDEASTLLGNLLNWQEGFLSRQAPVLEENYTLKRKIKPFAFISQEEITLYAELCGIDYLEERCPFSRRATSLIYKGVLNKIEEEMPATKLRFYKGFIKREYFKGGKREELSPCKRCGYLTVGEVCNFCKLKEKVLERKNLTEGGDDVRRDSYLKGNH